MIIRTANKFDLPHIIKMLKHFREQTPIDLMRDCNDEQYINKLYHHIILGGGLALVAEMVQPIGMIIGIKDQNIWDPELRILRELVYWVEPNYRNGTAGYKLIRHYTTAAQEMVDQNRIKMFTMSKMVNSPNLDYGRFGYRKIEETWVAGA